jgi:hypothetical protein
VSPNAVAADEGYFIQPAEDDTVDWAAVRDALTAAPPIEPEPLKLTRQAARRMAIQIAWARISQPDETGRQMPRDARRRLMFGPRNERMFNFSDLARGLMGLS